MKWVDPEVYLVAETRKAGIGILNYLTEVGVPDWKTDAEADGEELIEVAGRMCYRSFSTDLNANLTKVREGNLPYIQNIVRSQHGSVLEHASCTFIFRNVSRVFTHELVRHRAGCAISQESLRYVVLDNIPVTRFAYPELMDKRLDGSRRKAFEKDIEDTFTKIEETLAKWRAIVIEDLHDSMTYKKQVTSLLRRIAPIGLATSIMWTANFRALRHVLELRTMPGAEAEIRHVFDRVGLILTTRYPAVFSDFTRKDNGLWTPKYSKV